MGQVAGTTATQISVRPTRCGGHFCSLLLARRDAHQPIVGRNLIRTGTRPELMRLIRENRVEAYSWPVRRPTHGRSTLLAWVSIFSGSATRYTKREDGGREN